MCSKLILSSISKEYRIKSELVSHSKIGSQHQYYLLFGDFSNSQAVSQLGMEPINIIHLLLHYLQQALVLPEPHCVHLHVFIVEGLLVLEKIGQVGKILLVIRQHGSVVLRGRHM